MPNRAAVTYQFRPFVSNPPVTVTTPSNIVLTQVNTASLQVQKSVNTDQAGLGDTAYVYM